MKDLKNFLNEDCNAAVNEGFSKKMLAKIANDDRFSSLKDLEKTDPVFYDTLQKFITASNDNIKDPDAMQDIINAIHDDEESFKLLNLIKNSADFLQHNTYNPIKRIAYTFLKACANQYLNNPKYTAIPAIIYARTHTHNEILGY